MNSVRRAARRLIAAAILGLAAASAHAQSVSNGSFEDPALVDGNVADGAGADWTANFGTQVTTNGFGFGTTPYGNQWEYLADDAAVAQTLSGTFTLNETYTLSVAAAAISFDAGDELTLTVSGGAAATQTFTVPIRPAGDNSGALPFSTSALAFTPTTTAPVTITLADTSYDIGELAVDNIQLVPEPPARALLGLGGTGALGVALCRRRARQA